MPAKDERPQVWVGHVVLPTPDLPTTRDFMLQVGMRPIADGDDFAVLELRGGTHLVLVPSEELASGSAKFDLMVDDLDATHEHLRTLGLGPSEIESGRIHRSFTVSAPSGHAITFNSSHVSDKPV
ncbi:MAG: VOC family protein [Myxococcota bacterium]|jgi:catechol 2,3-dioxygenase-like lactoylglutathione lyase family enzyme